MFQAEESSFSSGLTREIVGDTYRRKGGLTRANPRGIPTAIPPIHQDVWVSKKKKRGPRHQLVFVPMGLTVVTDHIGGHSCLTHGKLKTYWQRVLSTNAWKYPPILTTSAIYKCLEALLTTSAIYNCLEALTNQ